nr:hypothetical protein [uncultured Devosia sp.]
MVRYDPHGFESRKQHPASPGLVADEEIVCRGACDPMHYDKGRVKGSVIKANDLLNGTLSVWRGGTGNNGEYQAAVDKIAATVPNGQKLKEVFAPLASAIRDIAIEGKPRVFYVIDDCQVDNVGGSDPLHGGVKLCPDLGVQSKEDEIFSLAKNQLLRVLKLFPRTAAAAA